MNIDWILNVIYLKKITGLRLILPKWSLLSIIHRFNVTLFSFLNVYFQ